MGDARSSPTELRSGVSTRWLEIGLVGAMVLAYVVALWQASSWVWAPLLIPVAGHVIRLFWPRVPGWLVLAVTMVVVVALNFDLHAEGAIFMICMGAFAAAADSDRWLPERALLALAVASPVVNAVAGSDAVRDWNWPFWSMGVAVSWGFGAVLLHQRRLAVTLREAQAQLARQAAGEERRRIAREVHDLVGHSLTVVLLQLTGARRLVRSDPDEAERALEDAEQVGRHSLQEIRRTVSLLREEDDGRTPTPGSTDLPWLIEASRSAGLSIDVDVADGMSALNDTTGLAVYRIVQESLANVARHAAGASAQVRVKLLPDAVHIEVANGGGGIAVAESGGGGSGIVGMQERAQSLGGRLTAGPVGQGWRVDAVLPRQLRPAEVIR